MRIAIIGTGIYGLTCAHLLGSRHDVTGSSPHRTPSDPHGTVGAT